MHTPHPDDVETLIVLLVLSLFLMAAIIVHATYFRKKTVQSSSYEGKEQQR
jgi:uncharacterized membrane protein